MGPRKRLPKEEAVKTFNDSIDGYIHPPKFRDGNVKITIYSSLLQLAEVRDWLSVDEQAIFKGTAIGHLLSVPADLKYSGTILHFLLSREIHVDDKPDEMHFKVGGKILHFGKREFALVTGLSFKKPEKDFVSPLKSSSLMWTHFPNQYRVTGLQVKALLFKKNSTCPSQDRVKLALLLVVHRFLMGCPDRDAINISYWHLVDDLEEFNKYPWGEATFGRLTKFRSPLLYQANKENSGAGGETKYKVVGISHALSVWALDIMPGLLNLCGRKIESIGWLPHMLCVLCTQSPKYPSLRTLEMNDVHVRSDIMWQKGDANQLIVLGLEEGTPEIEVEVPVFLSKKGKISTKQSCPCNGKGIGNCEPEHMTIPAIPNQEPVVRENENDIPHTSVEHSHGKAVPKGKTTGIKSLEVVQLVEDPVVAKMNTFSSKGLTPDSTLLNISTSINVFPSPPGFTRVSALERVEGFQFVDDFKVIEEHVILYKKIYEKHGHMATKKVIKFNDDMLLTCVTSLFKIISAMEIVRGSELSEALLDRWEGFIKDAESLEFNIEWLREGFHRIKDHWRSSLGIDREVESHSQVLNAMQVKYDSLLTREDELETELSEVKVQKRKAEATISSEREAIQEKLLGDKCIILSNSATL
ncbi:uncharacterized protein LOC113310637 isoform X2 [Papaver somniferum]|uniref:uncharacterized protein LOC113310637 isoform X2 n=1 Tax=Papaver somniferum TaxID=3469 RepID=UPI000E6FEDB9|nr:uncharacterized protein LOC113310637 isoform X2 [Papaver somniferum]